MLVIYVICYFDVNNYPWKLNDYVICKEVPIILEGVFDQFSILNKTTKVFLKFKFWDDLKKYFFLRWNINKKSTQYVYMT